MERLRLLALVLGFSLVAAAEPGHAAELPGWKVAKTPHGYQELIKRVDKAVKNNKMGVVTQASATVGAKKVLNKTIPGNMVIGVYRPDFAVRMLEASVPAGIEAPIRLYITENEDGTATLSYKTPSAVFAPYQDCGQKLRDMALELDEIFARIVSQAAAP